MAYSDEFVQKQKQRLSEKRSVITAEIDRLKSEDPFIEEYLEGVRNMDTDDDVLELTGHQEMFQKVRSLKQSIKQIDKALESIKVGKYGLDEHTGETIDKARLEAYPEATTSV